jgi:hypothetical protein
LNRFKSELGKPLYSRSGGANEEVMKILDSLLTEVRVQLEQ